MKKIFFWAFALLVLIYTAIQHWPVTLHVNGATSEEDFLIQMPLKDKKRLDYFFRNVCFLNAWAYTIIGSKPVSIHHYTKPLAAIKKAIKHLNINYVLFGLLWPPNFREACYLFNPEQMRMKLGCDTLIKYIDHFPKSRFSFFNYFSDNNTVFFAFVDKVKLITVVKQHVEDFQEVLQSLGIDPEELYDNENLHQFFKGLNSDGLYGIVLGFGRDNAWLFEKYSRVDLQDSPMMSMWPEEDEAWLEKINKKDLSFQAWDSSDLFYPCFACDPESEETRQLRQTYREEREKIIAYYEGKDVVEATLSLLSQNR